MWLTPLCSFLTLLIAISQALDFVPPLSEVRLRKYDDLRTLRKTWIDTKTMLPRGLVKEFRVYIHPGNDRFTRVQFQVWEYVGYSNNSTILNDAISPLYMMNSAEGRNKTNTYRLRYDYTVLIQLTPGPQTYKVPTAMSFTVRSAYMYLGYTFLHGSDPISQDYSFEPFTMMSTYLPNQDLPIVGGYYIFPLYSAYVTHSVAVGIDTKMISPASTPRPKTTKFPDRTWPTFAPTKSSLLDALGCRTDRVPTESNRGVPTFMMQGVEYVPNAYRIGKLESYDRDRHLPTTWIDKTVGRSLITGTVVEFAAYIHNAVKCATKAGFQIWKPKGSSADGELYMLDYEHVVVLPREEGLYRWPTPQDYEITGEAYFGFTFYDGEDPIYHKAWGSGNYASHVKIYNEWDTYPSVGDTLAVKHSATNYEHAVGIAIRRNTDGKNGNIFTEEGAPLTLIFSNTGRANSTVG